MADGAEGVVDPEELVRLVGVPVAYEFGGVMGVDGEAVPGMEGGHGQGGGDDGFTDGRFTEQEDEAVLLDSLCGTAVGVGDDEGGQLFSEVGEQVLGLGVGAFVEDLGEVAESVDAGDEGP